MILKTINTQLDTNHKTTTWYDGVREAFRYFVDNENDSGTTQMLHIEFEGERSPISLPVREKMYLCNNNGKTIETIYPVR